MPKKSGKKGGKKGGTPQGGKGGTPGKKKSSSNLKPKKGQQHEFNENLFSHVAKASVSEKPEEAEHSRLVFEKYREESVASRNRVREIAAREYGWHPAIRGESAVTPYESTEEERRTAIVLQTAASEYGTLPSFQPVLEEEQMKHERRIGRIQGEGGDLDGAGPAEEGHPPVAPPLNPTEEPAFIDGLKMFRLEWEPTQAQRLPAHLPRAIEAVSTAALKSKTVKTADGKTVINWAQVLPNRASAACRMLLHYKSVRAGLEILLYRIPDTEWARSVIMEKLVSDEHTRGETDEAKEKMLGSTPFQAAMTILRWSTLGAEEHNSAKVSEPPRCRPANWEAQFKWGRFDNTFAMCLDLLTRLLSANPAVYEKGLTNTKASRVVHKHEAIEIALRNNLLEVLFLLIEKPKGYDTNNRLRTGKKAVLRKASQQLSVLAEMRMSKKAAAALDQAAEAEGEEVKLPTDRASLESGCMSSLWYAVYPTKHQVALEPGKKKGQNVYAWDRMKDKKRKSECTGHTGGFGKTTAPTPTEMAICILRGLTTSYLREDAAHGVAVDRCAVLFEYEFGKPDEIPTDPSAPGSPTPRGSVKGRVKRGPRTCADLVISLMAWIKNKGYGYEWYSRETGKILVETRPHRYFIGAPTRNDAWRVLHNLGTAIGRVAPMSTQGGWLLTQQAFLQTSQREGPWKGMNAAKYVVKQWLKLMDRGHFCLLQTMVNRQKPSYLDESIGVRRIGMLADTGFFAVADFSAIQLAQFLQGCTPARGELIQDLGYDPEDLPCPVEGVGTNRIFRAFEGREPLAVPALDVVVRAWFGDQNHEWDPYHGTDVTSGVRFQQWIAGREQEATLHADPAAWGVIVCGPPGTNVLLVDVQPPSYAAVDTSGRPIPLAPHVQITRAWFGAADHKWEAGKGQVVTDHAQKLQRARSDDKTNRTLLAQPGLWIKDGAPPQSTGGLSLVVETARPTAPLEQLIGLSNLMEDALYAQGHRDFGDHVHNLSLQRSMLNVWSALVVGCHDESVLTAVRQGVAGLIALLNEQDFAHFAPQRRGFLIALLGVSLQDAAIMPPGFWDSACNSILEALDYGTLRFRKNIVDDRHWVQLFLHAEKEILIPKPQIVTVKKRLLGGKKISYAPDQGKPAYISVVDLNGRYIQVENNTSQRLDVSGYTIRVLAANEFTDPADLERIDVRRKLGAAQNENPTPRNEDFIATFVFPQGCILGGPGELSGNNGGQTAQSTTCRIWHPCVSRSYADSEVLFSKHVDESTGDLQADFDPKKGDLTWIPTREPDNPAAALTHGEGAHGTTWLDPMVKRDKQTIEFLRRAIAEPSVRDSLPEVPYSTPFAQQGCQLFLFSPAGELVQMLDLAAQPPDGTAVLDGSGKADRTIPAKKWFEHSAATARTATQWADPDRVNVGFHGLFVEPSFVLSALRRLSLLPRHAYQLIQRGALAAVIDLLLELRLLRLEQKNEFHKSTCFDATQLQRVLSEITALDQVCALVQPFSIKCRRLFCSLILPEMQHVEKEPPLFPLQMGNGSMFAWDVVDDGRTGAKRSSLENGLPEWAPSSWAAHVNLGRLLLHFESDLGASGSVAADYRVRELAAVAWTTLCLRERLSSLTLDNSDRTPLEQLVLQKDPEYTRDMKYDIFVSYAERVNVDDPAHVEARKIEKQKSRQGFEDAYRRLAIIFSHEMPALEKTAQEMAQKETATESESGGTTTLSGKCLMPQRRTPRLQISDRVKRTRNPFITEIQERRGRGVKGVPAGPDAVNALRSGEHGASHCPSQIVASILRTRVVLLLLGPEFFESEYCKLELRIALLHRSKLVPLFVAPGFTINDVPTEFREDIRKAGWCWHINMWKIKSYQSLLEYVAPGVDGEPEQGGHLHDIIEYIKNPDPNRQDLAAADYMMARSNDDYSDYFTAPCTFCGQVRTDMTENLRTHAEACDDCWSSRLRPESIVPSPSRISASIEASALDQYSAPRPGHCAFCERDRPDVTANLKTREEACEECWIQHVEGYAPGGAGSREYAQPEGSEGYAKPEGTDGDGYLHIDGVGVESARGYDEPEGVDRDGVEPNQLSSAAPPGYAVPHGSERSEYDVAEGTDGDQDGLWAQRTGNDVKAPTPDYDTDVSADDQYMGFHGETAFEEEEETYFGAENSGGSALTTILPPPPPLRSSEAQDTDSDEDADNLLALWKQKDYDEDDDGLAADIEAMILAHEEETVAATKIQASFRGKMARDATRGMGSSGLDDEIESAIAEHERENAAASTIQAAFRGKQARDATRGMGDEALDNDIECAIAEHERENAAASTIQAAFRGKQARDATRGLRDDSLDNDIESAIAEHERESVAASTIQAAFRGKHARDEVRSKQNEMLDAEIEQATAEHEQESAAAVTIQTAFRGKQARDMVRSRQDGSLDAEIETAIAEHEDENAAAAKIQAGFRGMQARRVVSDVKAEKLASEAAAEKARNKAKPAPPPKPANLSRPTPKPAPPPKPAALVVATSKFCAQCGEKQPKKEVRFCPKCGAKCAELAEREEAAVKIQAGFRGMKARQQVAQQQASGPEPSDESDDDSDVSIDEEEALAEYLAEAHRELETATIKIQSAFRGSKARAQVREMRASRAQASVQEPDYDSEDLSDIELTAEELAAIDAEFAGALGQSSAA